MLPALAFCVATPSHSSASIYVGQTVALYNVAQEVSDVVARKR